MSDQTNWENAHPIIPSLRSGRNEISSLSENLEDVGPLHGTLCFTSLSKIPADGSLHVCSECEEDCSFLNGESGTQKTCMSPHFASWRSYSSFLPQSSQDSLENRRLGTDITNQPSPIRSALLREGKKDISSCSLSPTPACSCTPPSSHMVSLTSERKNILLTPPPMLTSYLHDRNGSMSYSSHFLNDLSSSSLEESRTKTIDQSSQENDRKRSRYNFFSSKRKKRSDLLFLSHRGTFHDSTSALRKRSLSVHPVDEENLFIHTDNGKAVAVSPSSTVKSLPIANRPSSLQRLCKPAPPVDSLFFLSRKQAAETLFEMEIIPPQKYLDVLPSPADFSIQKKTSREDESIATSFLLSSPPFQWDEAFSSL